jgi:excinuclease UvrABC helicase subunit UvrB
MLSDLETMVEVGRYSRIEHVPHCLPEHIADRSLPSLDDFVSDIVAVVGDESHVVVPRCDGIFRGIALERRIS